MTISLFHEITDPYTGQLITVPGPFVRSAYNYDMEEASDESGLSCPEPTRAQQQFKEECDINTIVERFGLTGELPRDVRVPVNGDFADAVTDFQSAMNLALEAEKGFMAMPANVRARFNNDPGQLVAFVSDPSNREEARSLGLLVPEAKPAEPVAVRVVPEPEKKAP